MTAPDNFRVLGLAPPRATWFRSVAIWSTSGALPAEFVKCVSVEEVRARLRSQAQFSALVVDAAVPAVDRDLLATADSAGCAVVVVADPRVERDWQSLGAARVLTAGFGREELIATLKSCARSVNRSIASADQLLEPVASNAWRGSLVAVTGPGGTGASVSAMALAQGLADDVRQGGLVLLADLRLQAEQAMLHDARDIGPGVQELAEAHRAGKVSCDTARSLTFAVERRRYHLLLGLRQARFWTAVRPRSFEVALDTLRRSYRVVVCDIDSDLEGEDAGGSIDIEERNVMSRTAAAGADVVLAVGSPGLKGAHSLVRTVADLCGFGVAPERVVPVFSRSPRSPRARAHLGRAVAELAVEATGGRLAQPIHLPEVNVEDCLRDGRRLPGALCSPLVGATRAVLARNPGETGGRKPQRRALARVRPGSLGHFLDDGEPEPDGEERAG